MNFSLVSTVFNEANRLEQTISDLNMQTLQPSEIILTDAGSTDGTFEILLNWQKQSRIPIIILTAKGCNVAKGRNLAIKAAKHDIIASTDFGCRFHKDWLLSIITPFTDTGIKVVGGAYAVEESDQNTLAAKAAYVISNGYGKDFKLRNFIPSSRSIAFKREVFEKIGGYCEWLTLAADDTVFGLEIFATKFHIYMVDKKYVYWGRHKSAKGFIKENYRYGLGDGEAGVNKKVFITSIFIFTFYITLFAGVIYVPVILLLNFNISLKTDLFLIYLFCISCFFYGFIKRWKKFSSSKYNLTVLFYGVLLLFRQKLAYIRGYCNGAFFSSKEKKQQRVLLHARLSD